LPRKYRPPAARRRKSKRPPPYLVEPTPQDGDVAVSVPDEPTATIARTEPAVAKPATEAAAEPAERDKPAAKHISRDYSYVRAEIRRIILVAGGLIIILIILGLFR
jgi:hypothetical protein